MAEKLRLMINGRILEAPFQGTATWKEKSRWLSEQLYIEQELTPYTDNWEYELAKKEPVIFDYHGCEFCIVWYSEKQKAYCVKDGVSL